MPEPITIGIAALIKWIAAHHAGPTTPAGVGAHASGTAAIAGVAGSHLTPAVVFGTTIAASTVGGITFINIYNHLLDAFSKQAKGGLRGMPSTADRRQILDSAYRAARAELVRKRILTPVNQADM